MPESNEKVEAWFARQDKWQPEIEALRAILCDTQLAEDFKWRSPCYTAEGGNIAALWSLKEACAIAFFKGALLEDSKKLLEAPGEYSRSMRVMKFASLAEIEKRKSAVKAYVDEAVALEKAGAKVEMRKDDLPYPEELSAALAEDAKLTHAFDALTPGRRRGYVLHFSGAKQSATRQARIEKAVPRILEGKGLQDR